MVGSFRPPRIVSGFCFQRYPAADYQRPTSGARLTDVHNGLRLMRRSAAARLQIRQNRMAHASEIVTQIVQLGLCVVEVPCTLRYSEYSRRKGQSMMGAFQILLDLTMREIYR